MESASWQAVMVAAAHKCQKQGVGRYAPYSPQSFDAIFVLDILTIPNEEYNSQTIVVV